VDIWENSVQSLMVNARAAERIGAVAVVTHLGSHMGEGERFGIQRVISAVSRALEVCSDCVSILLEITAGAGNGVGQSFEHLGEILNAFKGEERLGVCFDTCHAFAAGYDLRDRESLNATLHLLDREVGWERVKLVHANDSKGVLGSHLDRHEHIGKGKIGLVGFELMVNHPFLGSLPWVLETPENTVENDIKNIEILRSLIH
jgi:deoxyribonuclease-4